MALDKVGIYNDALILLGERRLSSISEAREPRYNLDAIWDLGAVDYCLSVVRPRFAIATKLVSSSTTDADHGYTNVFTLPTDYLSFVEVYSDSTLDQPISRRFMDATKICVNYASIYLRYNADNTFAIPSGTDFSLLSPEFVRVLSAYMAREYAMRIAPDEYERIDTLFQTRVKDCRTIDEQNEPVKRPKANTGSLSADWLAIYNDALLLLGLDRLKSGTDDSFARSALDQAVNSGVDYCLSMVRPAFAIATKKLTSSTTDTDHGYTNIFTLPADYLSFIEVYADSSLDQPIARRFMDASTICVNYSTVYLRYNADNTFAIPSGTDFSAVSPEFLRVLSAYMARETAMVLAPDKFAPIEAMFQARVKDSIAIGQLNEPIKRPKARTGTLSTEWLAIYNDALLVLGQEKLKSGTDDSFARSVLDQAVDSGIVASLLEDNGWQFAMSSAQSDYNPSYSMSWGYQYGHDYPADMHILNGIFTDEYFRNPLKLYQTEDGVFYCDYTTVFIQYVSTSYLTSPASWTRTFRRYVAAQMAKDSIAMFNADPNRVEMVWKQRKHDARSLDAQQSPPRVIMPGSWARSRFQNGTYNRDVQ